MAGDWLKVEKATIDKPEIRLVARLCDVSRDAAFAAWFRLWCWFDTETEDGHFPALTPEDCDDIGRLRGLGRACAEAGWIEFAADGGAIIRNWDRHNGVSAKKRALANRRKVQWREHEEERMRNARRVPRA